jgi:hypothetical protein
MLGPVSETLSVHALDAQPSPRAPGELEDTHVVVGNPSTTTRKSKPPWSGAPSRSRAFWQHGGCRRLRVSWYREEGVDDSVEITVGQARAAREAEPGAKDRLGDRSAPHGAIGEQGLEVHRLPRRPG